MGGVTYAGVNVRRLWAPWHQPYILCLFYYVYLCLCSTGPPSCLCVSTSVYVGQSLISGAGEGLFAKTDTDADTVMAFYNGVRITHTEVCSCLFACVNDYMSCVKLDTE